MKRYVRAHSSTSRIIPTHPSSSSPPVILIGRDSSPPACVQISKEKVIDLETFNQILDLDEDDTHDFSLGMAEAYFTQASTTFVDMDQALYVYPRSSSFIRACTCRCADR